MSKVIASITALALCLLALLAGPGSAVAGDIPQAVKVACESDYLKHCKTHQPGSDAGRDCMADVFTQLSDPCFSAILDSDLVGEQEAEPAKPEADVATAASPIQAASVAKPSRTKSKQRRAKSRKAKRRGKRYTRAHKRKQKRYARKHRRQVKYSRRKSRPRRIARYIKRGTRKAKFYVSRAFRKAFR